jgi:hypothetical protein
MFKPHRHAYKWAARRLGLPSEECILVAAHGWDMAKPGIRTGRGCLKWEKSRVSNAKNTAKFASARIDKPVIDSKFSAVE